MGQDDSLADRAAWAAPMTPGVAFWATVALVVVFVGYPLSFGPACWVTSRLNTGANVLPSAYRPIIWGLSMSGLNKPIRWYARVGAAPTWDWWRWEYRDEPWGWKPSRNQL